MDVPSRIWPRFHINLLRQAGTDPLPSQITDDGEQPPIFPQNLVCSDLNAVPEQYIERKMRADKIRRGRKWIRQVLVKWKDFAEPNWEDRSTLEDTVALDRFEEMYGRGDGVGENERVSQGPKYFDNKSKKKKKNNT